ncbi:MAG: YciI family protein [Actinomycetes bacterium]
MRARYVYFYFMGADAERVRATAPEHAAHWHDLGLDDYLGGPFEDRTGGLITFRAEGAAQAESAVATDPFVRDGLVETYWVKQWSPE